MEYLTEKLDGSEQVAAIHARIEAAGEGFGIDFRWPQMRRANIFDTRRLLTGALRSVGAETQRTLKKRCCGATSPRASTLLGCL